MSGFRKSSESSVSVRTLQFPEEYAELNTKRPQCYLRNVNQRKFGPVKSCDMGVPIIMSVKKPTVPSSPLIPTPPSISRSQSFSRKSTSISTSRKLYDTHHEKKSIKPNILTFNPPCVDSVVLGAPKPFIGNCPLNDLAAQQMSSKQLFSLTEDPRKRFCLRNPQVLHFKPMPAHLEQANVRELVKTAENLVTSSESQSSMSSICEVVDLTNPLNLDFQGMDYKNTYAKDEQSCQNQMEYRKVRRFKHRRNVKVETIINTENEQQEERISVPKHFAVEKRPPVEDFLKVKKETEENVFGKLIRAEEKPEVKRRLDEEEKNRRERYKQLYINKKRKLVEKEEEEREKERNAAENQSKLLAERDIHDVVGLLERTITTKKRKPRELPKRRDFPHTIREALKFRHQLKKSKRILRDRAKVKQEFYANTGKPKVIPEAQLEISTDSPSPSPRDDEKSTDDEDDMIVGQKGDKFLLRGFLFKLGSNLRGKFHQKEILGEKKVRGCMTREEWFETLLSKKRQIELFEKPAPGMELFPRSLGVKKVITSSPIKEFRGKPLGRHYDRVMRRNLRIRKPKQIRVKKFDMIGYLYNIGSRKKNAESMSSIPANIQPGQTMEYMRNRSRIARIKKRIQKRRRMHYLGIPCPQKRKKGAKSACVDSESGDSDWVPEDGSVQSLSIESEDVQSLGNMPAPEYREPTLRRHPRHPRDYKRLRVPSLLFDDFLQNNRIPIMKRLKNDVNIVENVRTIKNTEFGKKFEARHHHDHWNPTQHKIVHVRYNRNIVRPKPMEETSKKTKAQGLKTFDKARPRGDNLEEIDFAMPKLKTDEIISDYLKRLYGSEKSKTRLKEPPLPKMKDMVFHSIPQGEDELEEFPGREKFVEFLAEIKAELNKRAGLVTAELAIDKNAYLDELKEDLQSIESCLSSLSSSECTNLTNDSGSFLMAGDKKIPLDYIRKSLVPFEEMNRSRFEAVPIDPAKEEEDPYRTVPFAGQEKEQISMSAAKDSFYTFTSRLQNGLRLRLEVKQEDPRKMLLGTRGGVKAPAQVATDIDELYIEDLRNRPGFKPFKWNSCRTMIKDALRKKFESMLIQGEIVRTKIYDRRNEYYFEQMLQMRELFEKLFAKWEKKEYEAAMEVVNKVKPYYEATDKYRRESQELVKQYTVLNMDIVYIENDWMRRTILQNFHYLLAEMEWRVDNDWIHRTADGELEGFEESIAKRSTTNIRQRDKDDAWAIKEYYDNVYLQNYHPIIVVFKDAKEFINGIENLKTKTFILLLELHYTLWILAELDQKYQEFSDWCVVELESKKTYAENKCANKYYMENRANQLKAQAQVFLGEPIETTFSDKRLCQMKGIVQEVYNDVVPPSSQMDISSMEQVAMISEVLTDLIGKFEGIPVDVKERVEKKYRRILGYRRGMSKQAVLVERRIVSEMVKVRRNLGPPYVRPKREGNLPRSTMKKLVKVVAHKPVIISEKTKFFYKAFHEEGDLRGLKEARKSLDVMDGIQESIIPFYFDHFLSINGYQPNYNFKTQVELRDGPEVERFQVKRAVPEVLEKFQKWSAMKKNIMEENIQNNPQMYENVQT